MSEDRRGTVLSTFASGSSVTGTTRDSAVDAAGIWRVLLGYEECHFVKENDAVQYLASNGSWIDVRVICLEEGQIQIDAKKGQWLNNQFILGRLRTYTQPHRPCKIPESLEDSKISVEDIVRQSHYLESHFPEFLEKFGDVVKHEEIRWGDFLSFFQSSPPKPPVPTSSSSGSLPPPSSSTGSMPPVATAGARPRGSIASAGGYPVYTAKKCDTGVLVDTVGDSKPHAQGFDTTGDGCIDSLDTTGDGKIDTILEFPVPKPADDSMLFVNDARAADVAACRTFYKQIDKDGNGAISIWELVEAMQQYPSLAEFILPGVDCSNLKDHEDNYDIVDQLFARIAGGKKRASLADFIFYFSQDMRDDSKLQQLKQIFQTIDRDGDGEISKLELIKSVENHDVVASFMGVSEGYANEEDRVDKVSKIFDQISNGKRRASYEDFEDYFKKACFQSFSQKADVAKTTRNEVRLFVIGTGWGMKVNPRQTEILQEAGFVMSVIHLPNPEEPGQNAADYIEELKKHMDEFKPHALVSASKGDPYMIALWNSGLWTGPSLMINAHPLCKKLPTHQRIVMAHGSNDEIYKGRTRAELERLISTGSEGMCFLYYTADSGLLANGVRSKTGDRHNMASLLSFECLPRLVDAVVSHGESPEQSFARSWLGRLSAERIEAEAWLGYTPEEIRRLWERKPERLTELSSTSKEFSKVATIFRAASKEPSVYGGVQTEWQNKVRILRIQRVENGFEEDGYANHHFEALRKSLEDQKLRFEPGVHTRWLFHGTDAIEEIATNPIAGFQPLTSGTKGAALWGGGTYFARDAKYVADGKFAQKMPDGSLRMLMCLAMTGMPCLGDPQQHGVLPIRQGVHRYDCSVDSLSSPEIFIIQHPNAACPAYVITFC